MLDRLRVLNIVTSIGCFVMAITGINLLSIANPLGWLFTAVGLSGLILQFLGSASRAA